MEAEELTFEQACNIIEIIAECDLKVRQIIRSES